VGLNHDSTVKVVKINEGSEPVEFFKGLRSEDRKKYDSLLKGECPKMNSTAIYA